MLESIFDCREYHDKRGVPYIVDNARYGRPADTIIFYFAYTPKGRVSKFWWAHHMNYALKDKQERHRRYLKIGRPQLRGKLKGYRWSKAYLYSGNPEEWESYND